MPSGEGSREVDADAAPHAPGHLLSPDIHEMPPRQLEPLPCGNALALFRRLFSHSGDAALLTRPSGEFLAANAAACALFGASEAALLERSREGGHRSLADPGDPRLAAAIEARARDGSAHAEMRLRRFSGESFDADVSSVLFLDEGGEPTSLLTVRDISAQRGAEREVRALEQRLGFALDSAGIGDWDMDLRTNVAYRSLRHDQCFGYTEAVPTWGYDTFLAHVHADDRERVDAAYRRAMAGDSEYDVEFRTRWPDGSLHWLWSKGRFYFDDAGAMCRVAGIQVDISARRFAADALEALRTQTERHERMLTSALNAMQDFAHIYDRDGRFVFVNRPLLDLWQVGLEQVLGKNFVELGYPPELAARLQAQLRDVVSTRCSVTDETPYTSPAGEEGWYEYIFSPVLGPDGDVEFVVGSSRDITERVRNTQALEASAAEFRILAESMPQIVWAARPDGWHVHFNQQWTDYTGLSLEASLGHGWNPPFHPDDRERAAARWRQATESGEPYEFEGRLRRADGVYHWVLGRALPLRDSTGTIVKWFGTCTDIDELKKAQLSVAASNRALLDSEQRYRSLFEQNNAGVYSLDRSGHVVAANAAFLRLVGYTAEEALAMDSTRLVAPECRAVVAARFQQALAGEAVHYESVRLHRDGRRIEVDVNYQPLLVDGAIAGVHSIVRDITVERRAQDAIRTQAHMLDSIGQAVIATDLSGTVTYLNRFAEGLYGWTAAEGVGCNVLDIVVPEAGRSEGAEILALMDGGDTWRGEFRVRRRDGAEFTAAVTLALLRDRDGSATGVVGVSEDVSERLRIEEALRRQNALLANAQRVAGMGVWELDVPANHLAWSAETHRIFGIAPDAFDNTFEGFMSLVHPDDARWMKPLYEAPPTGSMVRTRIPHSPAGRGRAGRPRTRRDRLRRRRPAGAQERRGDGRYRAPARAGRLA